MNTLKKLASFLVDTSGKSEVEIAKALIDFAFQYAFETGIVASILSDYVTENGIKYAEGAADIAEEAKLAVLAVKKEGG
jgi:hypothetical protein